MKVLIVADEFFSWGSYGGFGFFSRKLGRELVRSGIEVEAWIRKMFPAQKPVGETESIDGVVVKTLPNSRSERNERRASYRSDADVIHSQGWAWLDTWFTFKMNPRTPKAVTFQDARTDAERRLTLPYDGGGPPEAYSTPWGIASSFLVKRRYRSAVRAANLVASQAVHKIPFIEREYGIRNVRWLPNMVDVPEGLPRKADVPTVLFLGRLDPIKRPELFCEIAKLMPDVRFHVLGTSHFGLDAGLRSKYDLPNLKFEGFDEGQRKVELLSRAWTLVNTSVYECLPISFLEAGGYGCSIVSCNDPDAFASRFGEHVRSDSPSAFALALRRQFERDRWAEGGREAHRYVEENYDTPKVVEEHRRLYQELTGA
ncbi:MAG TPA: glycosyltransferase family 4 protein [Conexivisphaerales archaeon]|nr:glycosyltransferase family 4 protein [Conexivisphaerales archaeon]